MITLLPNSPVPKHTHVVTLESHTKGMTCFLHDIAKCLDNKYFHPIYVDYTECKIYMDTTQAKLPMEVEK